eukprot:CAMPEP_0172670696 /NCGR_PEP_ID=MMETSP1074-20121228/10454_1 /TAXON_ID=2916 /ORGANISM="Ceratium fusus, Strain PA161109" /LENGTH=187 /DNA_ID=CAMNT_0013487641 /DNA_START=123 /DNA_END=686 /DNA_ORIENTATION=-
MSRCDSFVTNDLCFHQLEDVVLANPNVELASNGVVSAITGTSKLHGSVQTCAILSPPRPSAKLDSRRSASCSTSLSGVWIGPTSGSRLLHGLLHAWQISSFGSPLQLWLVSRPTLSKHPRHSVFKLSDIESELTRRSRSGTMSSSGKSVPTCWLLGLRAFDEEAPPRRTCGVGGKGPAAAVADAAAK